MCLPCCMTAGLQPARPQHEASYDSAVRQVVRGRSHTDTDTERRDAVCQKESLGASARKNSQLKTQPSDTAENRMKNSSFCSTERSARADGCITGCCQTCTFCLMYRKVLTMTINQCNRWDSGDSSHLSTACVHRFTEAYPL